MMKIEGKHSEYELQQSSNYGKDEKWLIPQATNKDKMTERKKCVDIDIHGNDLDHMGNIMESGVEDHDTLTPLNFFLSKDFFWKRKKIVK